MQFADRPRRTRNLSVRLSDDEMQLVESEARARNLTVTQLVRSALAVELDAPDGPKEPERAAPA